MMNRRVLVSGGLLILLGVVVSGLVAIFFGNRSMINQEFNISAGIASGVVYEDNTIIGSNGYGLISFNYVTGTTKQVSKNDSVNSLANIISLSGSDDRSKFVFKTITTKAGGLFENILKERGLPVNRGYWWLYNTDTGIYRPLPENTLQALISNDNIYTVSLDGDNGTIITYDYSLSPLKSTSVLKPRSFYVSGENIILSNGEGVVTSTKDGVTYTTISSDFQIAGTDGSLLVGTNKLSQLVVVDLVTGEEHIADKTTVSGSPAIKNGLVLYLSLADDQPVLYSYNTNTHQRETLKLSKNISDMPGISGVVAVLGEKSAIITTTENSYAIIGNNITPPTAGDTIIAPSTPNP